MKILITGANGQLGNELQALSKTAKMVPGTISEKMESDITSSANFLFVDRDELDITDRSAVEHFFSEHKPDYCINAAAYTDVEKAEDEYAAAYAVNAFGAENIAKACEKNAAILFHISTDFVFDGEKTVPYGETDKPNPLGAYARTKYEGELAVQEYCQRAFIVRTSWLYSSFGKNFVKTILRLCAARDLLPVVADQYGSPTYALDLAVALLQMIGWCELRNGTGTNLLELGHAQIREYAKLSQTSIEPDLIHAIPFGIYHYANEGEVTWFEFAQKICDIAGLSCELKPIPSSEYPSKVQRPAYSALSTKKIKTTFGIAIPEWDESIKEYIEHIVKS